MYSRIAFAAFLLVTGSLPAIAQSSTATSGTIPSVTPAPNSNTLPNGQPKYLPPPAARSGEKGLRVGNDVDGWIEIKRKK